MARNQEKSQSTLNRLLNAGKYQPEERRPHLATEVKDIRSCEKWRRQVISEIARHVGAIQNAGLGEHKLRDLNDLINKGLREKKHWERQIVNLGGINYSTRGKRGIVMKDGDGNEPLEVNGYFYFGAARDLKGVRELFEAADTGGNGREGAANKKRTRHEMQMLVDAEYYGYRDDTFLLEAEERTAEKRVKLQLESEFNELHGLSGNEVDDEIEENDKILDQAFVALPTREEIEAQVVARRKQLVMEKFGLATAAKS